ncbi:hypothetical protein [Stenotrophomonas phage vB_SmeS_BUCT700]|uniref:Uncharacterized protein n=1 Tax=Stenotrophomonas phage vB_SmeS_BUCT700 TaxID=2924895 RepID=A0AAE9GEE2_9CAUD|nr:hypothetical protein [Stenotrophomonas phage vB_SmeS_BUCT700]UNY50302.1 hypothetical protein [Stenotrophomonas phage vB_SmeS_BUCT703]
MGLLDKLKKLGRAFMASKAEDISVEEVKEVMLQSRQTGKSEAVTALQTFRKEYGKVKLSKQLAVVPEPPYRRSTTALRRFQRDANRQYLHVSVDITPTMQQLTALFGMRWFRSAVKGNGSTYRKEKN